MRTRSVRTPIASADIEQRTEFLRGPKWRTRTTPRRRVVAVAVTFTFLVAIGCLMMVIAMVLLDLLGAPGWVQALPWLVPTLMTLAWNLKGPRPASLSGDDDERWSGHVLRAVLVGTDRLRTMPLRVLASLLFGGPVGWLLLTIAAAEIPTGY